MNKVKHSVLILLAALLLLFTGVLGGCSKTVDVYLKTVYVVYPNIEYDGCNDHALYVTRTVNYRMDALDNDNLRNWSENGSESLRAEIYTKVLGENGELQTYAYRYKYGGIIGYSYVGIYDRFEGGNRICFTPRDATANDVRNMPAYSYYYARYDPIPIVIQFNSGEGGAVGERTELYDATLTSFAVPTPPSARYVFDGWYSNAGLTDRVTDASGKILPAKQKFNALNYYLECVWPEYGGMVEPGGEGNTTTLYAKYVEKTYTVTFDYGDGREEMDEQRTVVGGSVLEDLPSPEIDGRKVASWTYDIDGYNPYNGEEIASDTVLHAVWRYYKYIDLWSNGEKVKNLLTYYGETYYPETAAEFALTREGYTLAGWFTSPYFETGTQVTVVNFSDSYRALYAKWVPV